MPFDEAQLEITGDEEAQGFINNNPAKNSPGASSSSKSSGGARSSNGNGSRKQQQRRPSGGRKSSGGSNQGPSRRGQQGLKNGNASNCPGGSIEACIETCVPLEQVSVYGVCATECGKRCGE